MAEEKGWQVYKRLIRYALPFKYALLIAILGNIGFAAVDATFIKSIETLIDKGFNQQDMSVIQAAPIFVIIAFIIRGTCSFCATYVMAWVGSQIVFSIQKELFAKFLSLPMTFFDNSSSGTLMSQVTYNTSQVSEACTEAITIIIREGAFVIFLISALFITNWKLSLIYLVIGPMVGATGYYFGKRFRTISKNMQASMGALSHVTEEALVAQREVKIYGGQTYEQTVFNQEANTARQQRMKYVAARAISAPLIQSIAAMALAVTVYFATQESVKGNITAGEFTAMMGLMMALLRPLKQLSNVNSVIQKGIAAAANIFNTLDQASENDTGTHQVERASGRVSFSDVTFSYPAKNSPVLKGINLDIQSGETVALVGSSGSGKTTLTSLLPRFYDNYEGDICIDGVSIRDYPLSNLRKQIAIVSQQVTLFNDTIRHNLSYGNDDVVTDERLIEVGKQANALQFIQELPNGFDTLIGQNGLMLSGGQRQRLAIARALLKDAPILILDEATSALDTESERQIQMELEQLMENRTTLVIAHRLSTIEKADRILVMDQGQIVESGNHKQLLSADGRYAELYRMQFNTDTEEDT